ncbi:2,3-bisphosphoglycerate-independent phosphoglycerate mutase [Sphingobacteriales bacterium UPWRP_1]|nr:phosphoglycerate mutase (2,3-diphosphoglycerate-independent) [Sphingobacteriales bacterium TSM_CSS]PSJ73122.1 2,3-bisphosphoglycerate-independent phosphoglycerate mutase [Sphingobacteriales bacterium UPWRP_1]
MFTSSKVALIILDGWGHGLVPDVSAIAQAKTPFVDSLYSRCPNAELTTHGEAVGLPEGQMGNSEVGHLNIGAGRIVYQELQRINLAATDGTLANNPALLNAIDYALKTNKPVHLLGLVSDGGVHSHLNHLAALCQILNTHGLQHIFIHAFTDGRDTAPTSGIGFLTQLQQQIQNTPAVIASVIGRYYAMDRDKRWERVKLAYDLLTLGEGMPAQNIPDAIQRSYENGITDEFIKPIVAVDEQGKPLACIKEDDVVICFNFRTDRCREITTALTQQDFPEYNMRALPLHYVTMTRYDDSYKNVAVIFEKDDLVNTLGEVLEKYGKRQIRIAETEKYPHVTFFFSGGRETPFANEKRLLLPSPKVATYDLMPQMSAPQVTEAILPEIENETADFICLNFANADMVGHTGVFEAAIKAVETVDQCLQRIVTAALQHGYACVIIADHGNADIMRNPDGSPHTSHTTNLVPVFIMAKGISGKLKDGKLADIAPTILSMMQLPIPPQMTGNILFAND